jgi:hypothetical protein
MSAEQNMALARRFMEARVVNRDLNAVDQMLAPTSSTTINWFLAKNSIARITCGGSLLFMVPSPRAA